MPTPPRVRTRQRSGVETYAPLVLGLVLVLLVVLVLLHYVAPLLHPAPGALGPLG